MYKNLNEYQKENYKTKTKKELLQTIDWMQGDINKHRNNDLISGCYTIEVYKNKIPVQTISLGWSENPHGANFSEVKQLAQSLMTAYQDYESLIETKIILLDDWDELKH